MTCPTNQTSRSGPNPEVKADPYTMRTSSGTDQEVCRCLDPSYTILALREKIKGRSDTLLGYI